MPSRSIIRTGVGPHREPGNRFPAMAAINLLAARAARALSRRNLRRALSPKLDPSHSITRCDRSRTGPKCGFVSLGGTAADAFLHLSVLKSAGYVSVPAGTSMQVSVETDRGRLRVVEVSNVDTSTAWAGEPAPVLRNRFN